MLNDEKQLLSRLKNNDQKAFDEIFRHYYSRIFNLAYHFLHSREEAQEIVQIVFIAIWENRFQIDEQKSFPAYIQSIARHTIYNQLKKAVYRQRFIDFTIKQTETEEAAVEEAYQYKELQEVLENAIAELPPRRREIFYLSRSKGLSYKEIALKLSITESTVNTQISKSIEFLRKKVKEFGVFLLFLF
jgi:RNA polymerase sigma-70 factor (ECF subfamily)